MNIRERLDRITVYLTLSDEVLIIPHLECIANSGSLGFLKAVPKDPLFIVVNNSLNRCANYRDSIAERHLRRRVRRERRDFLPISQKKGFFFADFALFKLCALRVLSGEGFLQ